MGSIFGLLDVLLSTPDHSTLSRRASKMTSFSKGCSLPEEPVHLLIDSIGLKVFGAGEWLQEKHGVRARWAATKPSSVVASGRAASPPAGRSGCRRGRPQPHAWHRTPGLRPPSKHRGVINLG